MRALLCAYYERIINSAQGAWEDRLASCGQLSVTCRLGISTSMVSPGVLRVSRDGDQRRIVSGKKKKSSRHICTHSGGGWSKTLYRCQTKCAVVRQSLALRRCQTSCAKWA